MSLWSALSFVNALQMSLGIALLTPHVRGYVGEKNSRISHMSATASLSTLPAVYTLQTCAVTGCKLGR